LTAARGDICVQIRTALVVQTRWARRWHAAAGKRDGNALKTGYDNRVRRVAADLLRNSDFLTSWPRPPLLLPLRPKLSPSRILRYPASAFAGFLHKHSRPVNLKTALGQSVGNIERSERRVGHAFDRDNAYDVGFCRRTMDRLVRTILGAGLIQK
jgi:hypothetical protein